VAIVGGGISGLALALALQQRGFANVRVFERDTDFSQRRQGYGLTMQQGATALRAMGFTTAATCGAGGIQSTRHLVMDQAGRQLGQWGSRVWGGSKKRRQATRQNVHIARQVCVCICFVR
jgi:2-polyprenyl-6-methoxyphenol hydroxylase-like FAD-dependent oxidoreductase